MPLEAFIVAVNDAFDALTSLCPYRGASTNEPSIQALKELAGEKLDQDYVNALLDNMV